MRNLSPVMRFVREVAQSDDPLLSANAGLVVWGSRRLGDGLTPDEVLDGAVEALFKAHLHYDPAKSKFTTFFSGACRNARIYLLRQRKRATRDKPYSEYLSDDAAHVIDDHETSDLREKIRAVIDDLPNERLRFVVKMRYGIGSDDGPRTCEEVGALLKISRQRVKQLEIQALEKLRPLLAGLADAVA